MPDLATILGVQIAQKLKEIQQAAPPANVGYLGAHKGGQAVQESRTYEQVPPDGGSALTAAPLPELPPATKSYLGARGRHIGDGGPGRDRELGNDELDRTPLTDGNKFFLNPNRGAPELPPVGSDPIVEPPQQPLIVKKGGKSYLMMQVPAVNERGQLVDVVGPKGAPMVFEQATQDPNIKPIPNAPPGPIEFRDNQHKGVFTRHMKTMYEQMIQQIQNQQGIPV